MSLERKIVKVVSILLLVYGIFTLATIAFYAQPILNGSLSQNLFVSVVVEGFLTAWACIFAGVDGVRGANRPSKIGRYIIWMIIDLVIQVFIVVAPFVNSGIFGSNNTSTLAVSGITIGIIVIGLVCGLQVRDQSEK